MPKFLAELMLLLTLCGIAGAQPTSSFLGTWKVTWQGEKRPQEARLIIADPVGSWKTAASSKTNNCVGKEVPVVFEQVNGDEAKLKLKFSELPGCSDATISIKKVDDKTMTGFRGKAELSIVRN